MSRAPRWIFATILVTFFIVSGGCASTRGGPRPAPFPTAPAPAVSIRPMPIGVQPGTHAVDLIRTATGLRGVPYRLGGESPASGFDCSGFVRYVFSLNHLDLPRTVTEQYAVGQRVRLDDIREGDLIFFATPGPAVSHVGLAIGNGEFIHAPGTTGAVRVEHLDVAYWHNRIVGVRRLL